MAQILSVDAAEPQEGVLISAAGSLRQGGVVAFPTETFYGLGASIDQLEAIQKVFAIKGRDPSKPVLLLIEDLGSLEGLTPETPPVAARLMERVWPGPLTLLFHAAPNLPPLLTGSTGKVGIRLSPHPVCRGLIRHLASPITGTSANLSGRPSCSRARDVAEHLGVRIDLILDAGETQGGVGSTIVDATQSPPSLVREGAIPFKEILNWLSHGAAKAPFTR